MNFGFVGNRHICSVTSITETALSITLNHMLHLAGEKKEEEEGEEGVGERQQQ